MFTPTSELYERWVEPPVPAYQKFYFFDIQNPDDVLDGARPKVIERGPYVYRYLLEYAIHFIHSSAFVMRSSKMSLNSKKIKTQFSCSSYAPTSELYHTENPIKFKHYVLEI